MATKREVNNVFIGTELKLNLSIKQMGGGISMADYDFTVEAYCSPKKAIVVHKNEALKVDDDNYIIRVDTQTVGAGQLKLKVTAHIPDMDFPDMIRTEVQAIDTGISIIKSL